MIIQRSKQAIALIVLFCTATWALGDHFPQPDDQTLLTVSGNVSHVNRDDRLEFDRDMLTRLEQGRIVTENPWADGENTYEGPLLSALLDAVGASGDTLVLTALNDYSAELPLSDAYDYDIILATHMNGDRLSVRERGPMFVIYPFSDYPELDDERYHNRSVWQVRRIRIQ